MESGELSWVKLHRCRRIPWSSIEQLIDRNTTVVTGRHQKMNKAPLQPALSGGISEDICDG